MSLLVLSDQLTVTQLFALILSTANLDVITKNPEFQAVLAMLRQRAQNAKTKLEAASVASTTDRLENAAAIEEATQALANVLAELAALATDLRYEWLPHRAEDQAALGDKEFGRRTRLLDAIFPISPREISRMGRKTALAHIETVEATMASNGVPAERFQKLTQLRLVAEGRLHDLQQEELDDAEYQTALVQARDEARREYRALRDTLATALAWSQSAHSLTEFVLAQVKAAAPNQAAEVQQAMALDTPGD